MLAASGGTGARVPFYGNSGCRNNIAPFCNGAALPSFPKGNAGLSGPDPQTWPGVANLTKGTITLDQLPSVDSLLPYYDQVQLDMVRCSLPGLTPLLYTSSLRT